MSLETGFVCPQKQCSFVTGKCILLSPKKKELFCFQKEDIFIVGYRVLLSPDRGFFCRRRDSYFFLETGIFYSQEEYSFVSGKGHLCLSESAFLLPDRRLYCHWKESSCRRKQTSFAARKSVFLSSEKILLSHQKESSYVARRMGLVLQEGGFFTHWNGVSFVAKERVHLL